MLALFGGLLNLFSTPTMAVPYTPMTTYSNSSLVMGGSTLEQLQWERQQLLMNPQVSSEKFHRLDRIEQEIEWLEEQDEFGTLSSSVVPKGPDVSVSAIYKALGVSEDVAIPPGKQVKRSDVVKSSTAKIHLDIGGEGKVFTENSETGFYDAINVQAADGGFTHGLLQTQNDNPPIENLVWIESWSNPLPFADDFADEISLQNAPLTRNNAEQFARVIRPGGVISLWIGMNDVAERGIKNQVHFDLLVDWVNGKVIKNDKDDRIKGNPLNSKTTIVAGKTKKKIPFESRSNPPSMTKVTKQSKSKKKKGW